MDFYAAKPQNGLTILENFKTIQQTTWWSCGASPSRMAIEHFGKAQDWNEETLAALCKDHGQEHDGTCPDQMIEIFEGVGALK